MRSPMRGTPFSHDLDRGDGFEKETSRNKMFPCASYLREGSGERGGTRSGYKGGKGESVIWPTTNEQPRAVMRSPMHDPMRDIDLMVLGDVGTSTPLPSTTREHRIQLASRTREPASTLLPLMARPPNFEAEFVFKQFCTLCATLCAGPLISQDLDRRAGSKRAP